MLCNVNQQVATRTGAMIDRFVSSTWKYQDETSDGDRVFLRRLSIIRSARQPKRKINARPVDYLQRKRLRDGFVKPGVEELVSPMVVPSLVIGRCRDRWST